MLAVFEYRFTAPNVKGEKKWWWVMWDYYNGLVRVHDFFDCCKPGKVGGKNKTWIYLAFAREKGALVRENEITNIWINFHRPSPEMPLGRRLIQVLPPCAITLQAEIFTHKVGIKLQAMLQL